jgi:signal transduction histidine kinase
VRGAGDEFDQLAEHLNSLFDRIQALMGGLRQVSNDIAHDLRTPLTRLRQRLELAQSRATSVAQFQDAVGSSIHDVDTILETFGAMLRVAEIEGGARKAGFTVLDLAAVLRALVDDYQPVIEEAGDQLLSAIADDLPVRGDRQLLTQMIANLIENAVRHCPAPATITLAARREGGAVVVEIGDTGPGIPKEQHAKVFQRLFRLEASRTTTGTGMGLAIVAAIAALHGITMTLADNRPGLAICLRFPKDEGAHVP